MRCAVIIENKAGAQVLGITSDEAMRIGKQGIAELYFGDYKLRFIVEDSPAIAPASTPALPWPHQLDLEV
jgi:hypothetical protein